ncbi:chloride channel protein [Neorhizobium petrolearium]|uniref:Chloride channel protein n=1 Tax=Neorhizobium petrolearium TaxID=515361 RepID=A0ABY8M5Y1_9HYPH|nr:chloride channel protein [Neorhizobium petrolearium]MCC2608883.1 chloride channel protein [Neorhizobium petrolearium]WGI69129.1 chloride channel protein [Neorhizobium petrolearium]
MPVSYRKSKMFRRSRVMRVSWNVWKPRIVFWIGAIAIGFVSVGFALAADRAQDFFMQLTELGPYAFLLPLVLTPAGFALCAWLAFAVFPNTQGSGIPQAIAARHLRNDTDRLGLLSLKLAVGKIVLTIVGLFCGASIGREGPTVQVGASIMLAVGRVGGMAQARGLILAGSAAGIAAAFNTPLAGIVFAIEEMSRTYESRANGLVLTAVILSGLAALGLVGSYTYFGETSVMATSHLDWAMVAICGICGGALGAAFSAGAIRASRRIRRWAHPNPLKRMVWLAAGCGLAVAVIGLISGGQTFGTGYKEASAMLEGATVSPTFFIEKLGATFLSMISGIPGGIFAPSLSVGVGLGATLGTLFGASIALSALLGMAGYFAGVVQAPMTAFVIIIEMTGDHEAVIPIMAASMLGYITSRMLSPEPLYHGLSRAFIAASIRARRADQQAGSARSQGDAVTGT